MPSIGRIVQIQVWGHVIDSDGVKRNVANSFCYRLDTVGSGLPTKNQLATAFNSQWSNIAFDMSAEWKGDLYSVWYPMDAGDTPTIVSQVPSNGAEPGDRMPLNQAVYCQLVTKSRGRSYYGRKHFGPIPVSQVDGDELNSVWYSTWLFDLKSSLLASLKPTGSAGSVWKPVVWSRKLSPPTGSGLAAIGDDVTAIFIDKTLGQCKNRNRRFWEICTCCAHRNLAPKMTVTFSAGSNPAIAGQSFDLFVSSFPCQRRSDTFTVSGSTSHWTVYFNCETAPTTGWAIAIEDEFFDYLVEETYADVTTCDPFNVQVHGAVTDPFSPNPGSLSDCTITFAP